MNGDLELHYLVTHFKIQNCRYCIRNFQKNGTFFGC